MSRKTALVTGGAGFVGSHVVERLLGDGFVVLCVDNLVTGSTANLAALARHPRLHLLEADVCEPLRVPGRLDLVMHLASPASPVDYLRLPIETMRVGAVGTLNALELARDKRARFLLASTSETYGDPLVHPQPESYWGNVNPVGPRAVYDEAKRFAEAMTTAYRTAEGVDTAIVRIFNTYGPRMRPDDGRAIPTFIDQALHGRPLTVAGDGSQTRSPCYVDDLVEGIVAMAGSDLAGPVNLGNPEEVTVLALAELVRRLAGTGGPVRFVPRPQDDPHVRRPDITLARTALGWQPQVDLRTGLTRTIAWARDRMSAADGLAV
jgi:dTDP-glucose 4,6-dehydratase